jgi:hypothetical protein
MNLNDGPFQTAAPDVGHTQAEVHGYKGDIEFKRQSHIDRGHNPGSIMLWVEEDEREEAVYGFYCDCNAVQNAK